MFQNVEIGEVQKLVPGMGGSFNDAMPLYSHSMYNWPHGSTMPRNGATLIGGQYCDRRRQYQFPMRKMLQSRNWIDERRRHHCDDDILDLAAAMR